jgi:hypothetical protein
MSSRLPFALFFLLAMGACNSESGVCQPTERPTTGACKPGTELNETIGICTDAQNSAFICRNGLGYCVICDGAFTDGCQLLGGAQAYCVHDCSHC